MDPSEYVHGWHIDEICEHLEAVNKGEIRNLLINVPPRCMKSLTVSVAWPVWTWTQQMDPRYQFFGPQVRWLFSSYAQALATRDSVKCRRIFESRKYRDWFGAFELRDDQNTKTKYDTMAGGYRMATSVGGTVTGEGGDIIGVDDPLNAQEAQSDVKLEVAAEWWTGTMSTRSNDVRTGARVVVMQRLHEKDTSGVILRTEPEQWTHLCLPMRFEPKHFAVYPRDPRTVKGELLWPEKFPEEEVVKLEKKLGSYFAAGQLQQRPAPEAGGLFKREHFQVVAVAPADCTWVRRWDLAATEKSLKSPDPDWTVGLKMGKSRSKGTFYIADVRRMRVSDLKVTDAVKNTASLDGRRTRVGVPQDPGQAGKSQVRQYGRLLSGYIFTMCSEREGDKVWRARPLSAQCEAGNVFLVGDPDDPEWWGHAFVDEAIVFPNGNHDDQVDAASGAHDMLEDGTPALIVSPVTTTVAAPEGYTVE